MNLKEVLATLVETNNALIELNNYTEAKPYTKLIEKNNKKIDLLMTKGLK